MTEVIVERSPAWSKPTAREPIPVVRCRYVWPEGHARAGDQCKRWSVRGTTVCPKHGGQLPNVQAHAAAMVEHYRMCLVDAGDMAVDRIVWLAENAGSEAVSLKASESILDRIGVRGGSELDVTVDTGQDPADVVRQRLATIRRRTLEGDPADIADSAPGQDRDTVSTEANPAPEEPPS